MKVFLFNEVRPVKLPFAEKVPETMFKFSRAIVSVAVFNVSHAL
jgi:hypothetical protein